MSQVVVTGLGVMAPHGDEPETLFAALMRGDSFVTSGEVLVPSYSLTQEQGSQRVFSAQVEWTYPLEFVELVWGDGKTTDRKIISATDLAPFGSKNFSIPFDATGKKWVRFAAWDSAGNGAILQPMKLGK